MGDRFVNGEVLLSIFTRPVHDCIASLSEEYGIYLKPTSNNQRMELFSKHEKAIIEGPITLFFYVTNSKVNVRK